MNPIPDLTPLPDGRSGLRTTLSVDVRSPSAFRENSCNSCEPPSSPSVPDSCLDFISSDATLDRYSEIISPAGWRLDNYRRNPVFQNAHKYGDIIFTLGRALITDVRDMADRKVLFQRIQFAVDANPMAKIAHALYAGGFIRAVSVGFVPLKWQDAQDPDSRSTEHELVAPKSDEGGSRSDSGGLALAASPTFPLSHFPTFEGQQLRAPQCRRRYLEQELLEVSAVAIPANPNALSLALKSGALESSDLRALSDLLHQALSVSHSVSPPRDISPIPQPLLHLARDLHQILRST